MVAVETITLLAKEYELNTKRVNKLAYKSIEDKLSSHIEKNSPALSLEEYKDVVKSLNLDVPKNRFLVLQNFSQEQLIELLGEINPNKLVLGLKFFTKEKLLNFIFQLPKSDMVKMLQYLMSKEELIKTLSSKDINNFLTKVKFDPKDILKALKDMPKEFLLKLVEKTFGVKVENKSKEEMLEIIKKIKPEKLLEEMNKLNFSDIQGFINQLLEVNPELINGLTKTSMMKPLSRMMKLELVESAKNIDPEKVIKMLQTLPEELLSQVVTLIEPDKLAEQLLESHTDLLTKIASI